MIGQGQSNYLAILGFFCSVHRVSNIFTLNSSFSMAMGRQVSTEGVFKVRVKVQFVGGPENEKTQYIGQSCLGIRYSGVLRFSVH